MTNRKNHTIKVTHDEITMANFIWTDFWRNDDAMKIRFLEFVGGPEAWEYDGESMTFKTTADAALRIRILCGTHAHTYLKALKVTLNDKNVTKIAQ